MTNKKDVLELANKISSICDITFKLGVKPIDQILQDLSDMKKSLEEKPGEPRDAKLAQAIEYFVTDVDWSNAWLSDDLAQIESAVSRLREDLDEI
ncbi:MAG: hypothetical protein JRJ69_10450 [Deltaproteobacteria bacterium]|nr:hypothetical protein [Deltaproteobacteria bacterium]